MGRLAVFAVFCSELSAMDISVPAEILAADGSVNEKTAKTLAFLPLLSAVFCCFCKSEGGPIAANSSSAPLDEIRMSATISQR